MTTEESRLAAADTDGRSRGLDAIEDSGPPYRYESGDDEPPSQAVVFAVAAVTDDAEASPLTLPPLYEVVDPDALDRLCEGGDAGTCATFTYAGHHVAVAGSGDEVVVRKPDPADG